jgi:hypothetical protein
VKGLKEEKHMNNQFITKDLNLAGLLYAKGVPFIGVNRNGKLCWFVFENHEQCERFQQQFFSKSLEVNAKEYADAIRTLKDLVFANE